MEYLLSMYQPDGGPPPDLDLGPIMRELGKINRIRLRKLLEATG